MKETIKKIQRYLLSLFSKKGQTDGIDSKNDLLLHFYGLGLTTKKGQSPLDIPSKAIVYSLFTSIVIAILLGTIFIFSMNAVSYLNLSTVNHEFEDKDNLIWQQTVDKLIPNSRRNIEGDAALTALIASAFENGINAKAIATLTLDSTSSEKEIRKRTKRIRRDIIGHISFYGIPVFTAETPEAISKKYGLSKNYNDDLGEETEQTIRRNLMIKSIQYLRGEISNQIYKPRRLLLAIGGIIQWVTFIAAIWCLIMLLMLRMPWAELQYKLVTNYRLPWDKQGKDVWEIQKTDKDGQYYFSEIHQDYNGKLVAPRLIKDVINVSDNSLESSTYSIITDKVNDYRDSTEIGEYEIINFLLWAVPTFGFIGTILGIISAMERAAGIFSAASTVEQGLALEKVSTALGTAFDTSFVALVWLIPMSYFLARTRKKEANLFEALDHEAKINLSPQLEERKKAKSS